MCQERIDNLIQCQPLSIKRLLLTLKASDGSLPFIAPKRAAVRDSTSSDQLVSARTTWLTDHDDDKTLVIFCQVRHVVEQLLHQLAALAEPLRKQGVGVDLHESPVRVSKCQQPAEDSICSRLGHADRQFLCQCATQRRFASTWRPVQEDKAKLLATVSSVRAHRFHEMTLKSTSFSAKSEVEWM